MTARGTMLWLLLAALSAFALFPITYQAKFREQELAELNAIRAASEQAIHVLHAEWAYLARPERLTTDAVRLLGAGPMLAQQIMTIDAVPIRVAEIVPEGFTR